MEKQKPQDSQNNPVQLKKKPAGVITILGFYFFRKKFCVCECVYDVSVYVYMCLHVPWYSV